MAVEYELIKGLLGKDVEFRIIITGKGKVTERQIEWLIKKLELDRDILIDEEIEIPEEKT